jgi:putative endonuclease
MTASQRLGRRGEDDAEAYYVGRGFDVIRNWRGTRGELDLICTLGPLVVFSEVKTRSSSRFGRGVEAVDARKQARIRRLAGEWLAQQDRRFDDVRFDMVDVDGRGLLQVYESCF